MMKEIVTEKVPLIVDMVSSRLNQQQSTSQSQTVSNSELEQNKMFMYNTNRQMPSMLPMTLMLLSIMMKYQQPTAQG